MLANGRPPQKKIWDFIRGHQVVDCLVIMLISSHVFLWFTSGLVIDWGDFTIPLDSLASLPNLLSTWAPMNSGYPLPETILVPWLSFFAALQSLGLGLFTVDRIYFFFGWTLAGLGAYLFAGSLVPDDSDINPRIVGLVAAVFYEFNLYAYDAVPVYLAYIAMPIVLGLFVKGSRSPRNWPLYLLGIGLASYGPMLDWPNVRMLFLTIFAIVACTVFLVTAEHSNKKRVILFSLASFATIAIFWAWFELPVLAILDLPSTVNSIIGNVAFTFGDQGYATLLEVSRLTGASNFPDAPFAQFYYSIAGIALSYSIPLLAIGAILLMPRNRNVLFCVAMAIVFLFLGAGPNPPLGTSYKWFVTHFWFLSPFVTSWYSLGGAVLFFSVLLGILAGESHRRLLRRIQNARLPTARRLASYLMPIVLSLLIVSAAFPLATSQRLGEYGGVNLPNSYLQANAWLSDQPGFTRILVAPSVPGYAIFNWSTSDIPDPYPLLLGVPFIASALSQTYADAGESNVINLAFSNLAQLQSTPDASSNQTQLCGALKVLNVRFVYYDGYYTGSNALQFGIISHSIGLEPTRTFGSIELYQVASPNPHIFSSTNPVSAPSLPQLLSLACSSTGNFLGFVNGSVGNSAGQNVSGSHMVPPSLDVSSTEFGFSVKVVNATAPFYLVLSEGFSPYWAASLDGGSLQHVLANGYSNAWYVDTSGTYYIQIQYWPNFLALLGFISSSTIILCLLLTWIITRTGLLKRGRIPEVKRTQ